jgi:hypothetical protein
VSSNGKHHFCFEADGDVVLYQTGERKWSSKSAGKVPTDSVGMLFLDNEDGQLVAEAENADDFWKNIPTDQAVQRGAPFTAVLKDDGNFEVTRLDGTIVWATNTTVAGEALILAESTSTKTTHSVTLYALLVLELLQLILERMGGARGDVYVAEM